MTKFNYLAYVLILVCFLGCTGDPLETLPIIALTENENKKFTFTNKSSGYYIGNSHVERETDREGWFVNNIQYLKEYRISLGPDIVSRTSTQQFNYYPTSFVRIYKNKIKETFSLLDSINSIIWEFELAAGFANFSFQPQLHHDSLDIHTSLTESSPQLVFSPEDLPITGPGVNDNWVGFLYIPTDDSKIVVICALEPGQDQVINRLNSLSKNYKKLKEDKLERITSFIEQNATHTNMPEITEAVVWAQLSLDALLTGQRVKGIWAGLPESNIYRARDTFISLTGALLVNGKFNEARQILENFSRYQLQNEEDSWDGRIPNQISDQEILYNAADVTWWFVRASYEYFLFTSDTKFIQQIFPVIKRAITGAIRFRLDQKFYLLHNDNDTWMNTRVTDDDLIPRGNRAIEIQALWYMSLQIGSIYAELNDEDQLGEHWRAISQTLKNNFNKSYWSTVRQRAYDHLNSDGSPDRQVRPNQIFTVHAPNLPGIEPLFEEEKCAIITSNVVQKLTYRYGVGTLWQEDGNFYPWHYDPSLPQKEESLHNGIIWSWLAGPVTSSLMMFNRQELAFNLYYDQAIQILEDDAIGNFAERRDAFPKKNQREPNISGNISQALSLAEFVRNFYQDIIGFQPNALTNQISISPKLPADLKYIHTKLPYADNTILFIYEEEEGKCKITLELEGRKNTVDIRFLLPGFDLLEFRLDDDESFYEFEFDIKNRRSFLSYRELDWYFAQPELREEFLEP